MTTTNGQTNGHPPPGTFEDPPRQPKKELTPEEMRAKIKELRVVNRYNRSLLESQVLMEAFTAYGYDGFGGSDTTEFYLRMRSQAGAFSMPPAQPSDRRGGAKWPIWRTDVELNRLRQASRVLYATNDYAKGMLRNQVNYTIGKGLTYLAAPKDDKPFVPDEEDEQATVEAKRKEHLIRQKGVRKIVEAVQKWIDDFCARNNWNTSASSDDVDENQAVNAASSTRERETHLRVDRDGEAFIRLFCHEDGRVTVRFVGPEMVYGTPHGETELHGWSYGIKHLVIMHEDDDGSVTRFEDLEKICAYYVRPHAMGYQPKDDRHDAGGEIVPAAEMVHIKDPWEDAEVKRGTPVLSYDTFDALMRAATLQRNVSITSAVQAATAEVWKHTTGTKAQIESLQSGHAFARSVTDGLGASYTEQRVKPGMIRRVPAGQEPVPDPATTQVESYLSAAQGDLRQAGAANSMPEYLISGDASNANFASTQESGTPYVRGAESRQEHYKTAFLRLMWRVVRYAVKMLRLPQEALTLVTINVEGMEIHKNNEGELATARTANLQSKVTSPQIEMAKLGNDPAKVMSDWKQFDKEMAPQQGGMPGQPGGAPPGAAPQGAPPPDQGGNPDDPLAGVPEADLSGEFAGGVDKAVDPKRSMAAKEAWRNRQDRAVSATESLRADGRSWVRIPKDVLEAIGGK